MASTVNYNQTGATCFNSLNLNCKYACTSRQVATFPVRLVVTMATAEKDPACLVVTEGGRWEAQTAKRDRKKEV